MITRAEVADMIEDAKVAIIKQGWKLMIGAIGVMLSLAFGAGVKQTSTDRDIADIKRQLPTSEERRSDLDYKIKLAEDIATIKTTLEGFKEKLK